MAVNNTKVVTGKVRLSFIHVFKPCAPTPDQEEKYSVTVLVPKTDVATKAKIDAAIKLATEQGVASKWNGVKPPKIAMPVYDGDGVKPSDGMPFGDECKGHWVFTASAKKDYPPQVVDSQVNAILDQSEVYSGIYGRVSINFFPYAFAGKKGIGVGLNNVQKLMDGEPLSGRANAAEDFGAPVEVDPITGEPI